MSEQTKIRVAYADWAQMHAAAIRGPALRQMQLHGQVFRVARDAAEDEGKLHGVARCDLTAVEFPPGRARSADPGNP